MILYMVGNDPLVIFEDEISKWFSTLCAIWWHS